MRSSNQTPEQAARDKIDRMLFDSGWIVQDKTKIDFSASLGIAVREYQTDVGPVDYVLFVALLHDSTAARVGALFQLLVQDTTAQDFGLPSSAIRLRM